MAHRPASLALRLTVSIGSVITVVLLAFGWIIERSIDTHFVQQDVDQLNAVIQAQIRISDSSNNVIYATPNSDLDGFAWQAPATEAIDIDSVKIWQDKGQTYRGAVVQLLQTGSVHARPLTLVVATDIDFHLHYLDDFRVYLKLITLAACLSRPRAFTPYQCGNSSHQIRPSLDSASA